MFRAIALVFATTILTGCASITDGTNQTIVVSISPREAICGAMRDSVQLGSVGGRNPTLTVSKGAKDIIITCNAPGYDSKSQRLVSSTQTAGIVGGIFLDLGIVDMMTGAMWKYPSDVTILMERSQPAVAILPPLQVAQAVAGPSVQEPAIVPVVAVAPMAPPAVAPRQIDPSQYTGGARAPPPQQGQDSWTAERIPESKACSPEPKAVFTGKGPGFESYTLACSDGDQLMIRCEFGNCRVLR